MLSRIEVSLELSRQRVLHLLVETEILVRLHQRRLVHVATVVLVPVDLPDLRALVDRIREVIVEEHFVGVFAGLGRCFVFLDVEWLGQFVAVVGVEQELVLRTKQRAREPSVQQIGALVVHAGLRSHRSQRRLRASALAQRARALQALVPPVQVLARSALAHQLSTERVAMVSLVFQLVRQERLRRVHSRTVVDKS